jgi:cyclopropane-fatty-acyl-phospholipid synthase
VLRRLLGGNIDALGEAYVRGDLDVEGRPEEIIWAGVAFAEKFGRTPGLRRLATLFSLFRRRHSRADDARWIAFHYDVSNDFYAA